MNWFDSHCHLKGFLNKGILEEVLLRAEEKGVSRMMAIGTSSGDWEIYKNLAKEYRAKIFYSVGLHPCYVNENYEEELEIMKQFIDQPNSPAAIGEIGLDYFHLPKEKNEAENIIKIQKIAFMEQLKLAALQNLPTVIHSRNAFEDCIDIIDNSGINWSRVLFHCFSEGPDQIKQLNQKGGIASFTGIITFRKNEFLRDALKMQGVENLILETDSPYLAPEPKRGKGNEPGYLALIGEYLSNYLSSDQEELANQSYLNTCKFYDIKI